MKENIQKDVQQTMIYLCQKTPEKECTGFSYMVPKNMRDAKTTDDFKNKLKEWICEKIHRSFNYIVIKIDKETFIDLSEYSLFA